MSDKDDAELAVLKQISTLTKDSDVKDKKLLRKILMEGKAYSPQEGYVIATTPIITMLADENSQLLNSKEGNVWEVRTPKLKHKEDTPIPYEFCSYTNYVSLPSDILHITRNVTFTEWIEHNDYKYKKITGGIMRRPINHHL
ncbi:MAG: hypothetical protein LBE76_08365 [Nitrososphaerota archaeon]|jgi:hypothetical protein|nr:hypothetical protein [Nitrososphaerota archaeon]